MAIFTIIIAYLAYKVLRHTGITVLQILKLCHDLNSSSFSPISQSRTRFVSLLAVCLACVGPNVASVQRTYMAQNSHQAGKVYPTSAAVYLAIPLIIVFLSIVSYAGCSHITDPSTIWPIIISDSSAIFNGFFVTSLCAMAMSTTDSMLNVASSMFVYDLIEPLRRKKQLINNDSI